LAREWFWDPSGRPTPPPPGGPAMEAVRSARERRFSDQLKPSPFWGGLPSPPPPPLPPVEDLISLIARAPKLIRRANGVVGVDWSFAANSSSTADSSMLPLLAELKLSRRPRTEPKGEGAVGEPERPRVVNDIRLRWAWAAALVIGPGYWPS